MVQGAILPLTSGVSPLSMLARRFRKSRNNHRAVVNSRTHKCDALLTHTKFGIKIDVFWAQPLELLLVFMLAHQDWSMDAGLN